MRVLWTLGCLRACRLVRSILCVGTSSSGNNTLHVMLRVCSSRDCTGSGGSVKRGSAHGPALESVHVTGKACVLSVIPAALTYDTRTTLLLTLRRGGGVQVAVGALVAFDVPFLPGRCYASFQAPKQTQVIKPSPHWVPMPFGSAVLLCHTSIHQDARRRLLYERPTAWLWAVRVASAT